MPKTILLFICLLFITIAKAQQKLCDQTKVIFDLGQIELMDSTSRLLNDCDGFKLEIIQDVSTNRLKGNVYNGSIDLDQLVSEWFSWLKNHSSQAILLFIDTKVSWTLIQKSFEKNGLQKFVNRDLFDKPENSNNGVIIFSLSEQNNSPDWVIPYWNYGFQINATLAVPTLYSDIEKGDFHTGLLLMNFFSRSELFKTLQRKHTRSGWSEWQFILNYLIDVWSQTGRKVNFFVTDPLAGITKGNISLINSFKIASGKVLHNQKPLDFVVWEGEKPRYTSGRFSFPIFPNKQLKLTPNSPGFEFSPTSILTDENTLSDSLYFFAKPVDINKQLKLYFPLKQNTNDNSKNGISGENHSLLFSIDEQRGQVAAFGQNRWIGLPEADQLSIVQSDFSVAVWLKLDSLTSEQCILGTNTNQLRGSIHLSLRNSIPYFGFYGNDQLGNTRLEAGKWYHIVWRYMKFSGEQAIFVNGELDSRSSDHAAYQGTDSIFIGRTTLLGGKYFAGKMSDFGLWNRALSENEIWLLSKDLSQLNSIKRTRLSYWIYGFSGIILAIILFWFYRRRKALLINEPPKMFDDQNKLPIISKPENSTLKSSVQLFGGFRLIDAQGINLISDLSPKIREFLLVLLLYSKKYAEGISNEELTQVLWRGFDTKKATNNRNVSVYKLRTILKDISVIELTFHDNFWRIELSSEIECDYAICLDYLKNLNEANNHNTQSLTEFYSIVSKGRLLPKDQFQWLDSFKEWIETDIIDTLQFIIDQNSATFTKDELIKWIDVLLIFDPINEEMLEKLMKTISDRKLAKHYYNRFANEYKLHFGEDFQTGFSELFD